MRFSEWPLALPGLAPQWPWIVCSMSQRRLNCACRIPTLRGANRCDGGSPRAAPPFGTMEGINPSRRCCAGVNYAGLEMLHEPLLPCRTSRQSVIKTWIKRTPSGEQII